MAACVPTEDGNKAAPEGTAKPVATAAQPAQPARNQRLNLPSAASAAPMPMPRGTARAPGARGLQAPGMRATPPGVRAAPPGAPAAAPAPAAAAAPAAPADKGPPEAPIKDVFLDFFERPELGPNWNATSPVWKIEAGKLCGRGAKNHPVWLKRKLPVNARIEFDAMSSSPDGDLKVELWGDGKSFAKGTSYTDATSYLAIFGGWKNSYHVLARIDEHAKDRPEVKIDPSGNDFKARKVMPQRWYHFKIERSDGKTIRWLVDDIELFSFTDPKPLAGEGHEHLGFNNWEVPVCFDNLKITPVE